MKRPIPLKPVYAFRATLLAALFSLAPAFGNDTTAELATGGLILTRSDEIELQSEDLFISEKEVRVTYRFLNTSQRDVVTHVAFPMPDIPLDNNGPNIAIPGDDPTNFLGFTTSVNGRLVAAEVQQKAYAAEIDWTDFLQSRGVPITTSRQALESVPMAVWRELASLGLADVRDGDPPQPRWNVKTTFYWRQVFPAGQTLSVEHRYVPSVGGSVPLTPAELNQNLTDQHQYCVEPALKNALTARRAWEPRWLEYVLSTGANWSGPIKQFRLVLDKGSPDNLVSFCGRGIRRIGPTQVEMRANDFTPTSNLYILFLIPSDSDRSVDSSSPPSNLADLNCRQLWQKRNSIFKSGGYCFKSAAAIRQFGNAGCIYNNPDEVRLSDRDRRDLSAIQRLEREKRCPR